MILIFSSVFYCQCCAILNHCLMHGKKRCKTEYKPEMEILIRVKLEEQNETSVLKQRSPNLFY